MFILGLFIGGFLASKMYFERLGAAIANLNFAEIEALGLLVREVSDSGGTIWIAGNGGSASTASHMAVDMSFGVVPQGSVRAISISDNSASLTATGNDVSFQNVFSRQLEALARQGDLLIVISASGNSQNLIEAVSVASNLGIRTAGLLGFDGGALAKLVDLAVVTRCDSGDYGVAEDMHLSVNHCLKEMLSNGG